MTLLVQLASIITVSLALGALTSFAQGVEALSSFANSVSGWTILTATLVALLRPPLGWGAALGAASFVSLVLGYTIASELRGLTYDPAFWGLVGLCAGPVVGAAAAATMSAGWRRALGSAVLAGILLTDALYGLTVVSATTAAGYWIVVLVLAGVLLVAVAATRPRSARLIAVQVCVTLAVVGLGTVGYSVLNASSGG